jgi:hypothetical protein
MALPRIPALKTGPQRPKAGASIGGHQTAQNSHMNSGYFGIKCAHSSYSEVTSFTYEIDISESPAFLVETDLSLIFIQAFRTVAMPGGSGVVIR